MIRHARQPVRARGVTITDLLIALVMLLLLGGGILPHVFSRTRESADRVKCASNLKQLGLAIRLYSRGNDGDYPRTRYDPTTARTTQYTGWASSSPFSENGPAPNDVTAALFLLIRTQDITSEPFVCPVAPRARPWDFGGGVRTAVSNFPHRGHISYGYTNPYPTPTAARAGYALNDSLSAEFAVAADMGPGGAALSGLTPDAGSQQMKAGNSPNHSGDGQNVMYGDGHVEFLQNPFAGVQRDNIYTAASSALPGEAFATSPVDANDSVIVPTALAGPVPPSAPPLTAGAVVLSIIVICGLGLLVLSLVLVRRTRRRA